MPRTKNPTRCAKTGGLLTFALCGLLYAGPALATAGDCVTSTVTHDNTNGKKEYRINVTSFDLLPGISRDEGATAVVMGADVWNEQGTAGYFQMGPSTALTNLPMNKADCDALGINYSLVLVEDLSGSKGSTSRRCVDASGKATQFLISIRTKDSMGTPWDWSVGTIAATRWDLVQTLAHEFGHTQRLGHPANGEVATMTPTVQGTNRSRDLYEWDLKCLAELSGRRQLTGYRRHHTGTAFTAESNFTGVTPIVSISTGVTKYTGVWQWTSVFPRNDCVAWQVNFDNTETRCTTVPLQVGIGPRAAVFRENEKVDRVLYSSHVEFPTSYAADGKHRVEFLSSSNGFVSSTSGTMSHCTAMSGFLSCSATTPTYSGEPVSVAWHSGSSRTVFAWSNQTRLNDAEERRVKVSVGLVNAQTLPEPESLGFQSSIGPAVTCMEGTTGPYACILAYTDQADSLSELRIQRFTPVRGITRYNLVLDTPHGAVTNLRTASNVAVWHNNGLFWLLVRPIRANQELEAYSSPDGMTWTSAGPLGVSAMGPTAVTYWNRVNNVIGYAR